MKKLLCIYHGGCDDGFGAAWVVRRAYGDQRVEFYPGVYNAPPPDVAGRDVLFVDFSYKRPVLEEMRASAQSILILDHHKTAEEDLAAFGTMDISKPGYLQRWYEHVREVRGHFGTCPVATVFDMERSGTGLAWDFFHAGAPRPDVVSYIEDRDLWRKALAGGDEFTIALRSYPQTFEQWDTLFTDTPFRYGDYAASIDPEGVRRLIAEGGSIQRYYRLQVEVLKKNAYPGFFASDDLTVPIGRFVNAPYAFASEVAGEIIDDEVLFGACFFQRGDGRWQYSLRSRKNFDVSALARRYGGGGHAQAAGFDAPLPVHLSGMPERV